MKLLFIDNEVELTQLVALRMSRFGYEVSAYPKCRGALEFALDFRPDAAVFDIMLGDGAGYQVVRQMRAHPELYLVPAMMLSAINDAREVDHAMNQGADDYLFKPFGLEDLLKKTERMASLRRVLLQEAAPSRLSLERITREMDHALLNNRAFRVLYCTVDGYDQLRKRSGPAAAQQLGAALGRILEETLEGHDPAPAISPMGGMHFLALLRDACAPNPAAALAERFDRMAPAFVQPNATARLAAANPNLALRCTLVNSESKRYTCGRQLLQEVQGIHRRQERVA